MLKIFNSKRYELNRLSLVRFSSLFYLDRNGYDRYDIMISNYYSREERNGIITDAIQKNMNRTAAKRLNDRELFFGVSEGCPNVLTGDMSIGYQRLEGSDIRKRICVLSVEEPILLKTYLEQLTNLYLCHLSKGFSINQLREILNLIKEIEGLKKEESSSISMGINSRYDVARQKSLGRMIHTNVQSLHEVLLK